MNKMTFDTQNKSEMENLTALLSFLISYNSDSLSLYNEIHIYQEESLTILEWEQVPYSRQYGGKFMFVDEDHAVLKHVRFPDNHYEYLPADEEEKAIDNWLIDNPGWTVTSYGTWTYDPKTEIFQDYLKKNTVKFADIDEDNSINLVDDNN